MEGSKTDYSKLVYRSGDNKYIDFARFARLMNNRIGINLARINMKEFKYQIDKKNPKKTTTTTTTTATIDIKKMFGKMSKHCIME